MSWFAGGMLIVVLGGALLRLALYSIGANDAFCAEVTDHKRWSEDIKRFRGDAVDEPNSA